MPELPEVEVTRRRIAPLLEGRRVARVHTSRPSYFFLTPPARLRRGLEGRAVGKLERVGKYLLAEIEGGARLLLHLGMTGQLFADGVASVRLLSASRRAALAPEEQRRFEPDRHTHLRFEFADGGSGVLFRDVRKFGKVQLLAPGEVSDRLDKLGTDALVITGAVLFAATRRRKAAIKTLLLDQAIVAGTGNIYADEALFLAGVRPRRPAGRVTSAECERIAGSVRQVMLRSIETGGSSISDYVAPDGSDGAYQDERRVYARTGEACVACGSKIRRSVLGARSAHWCPGCQR
jgi:formamidopyrimidine-DNA glycosylase